VSRCPDWRGIALEREADPLVDPAGWDEARAHLALCEACRREALAADPLLLFAGLPLAASEVAPTAAITAMQDSVLAMVRASRVAAPAASAAPGNSRRSAAALRYAAGFVVASLLAFSGAPGERRARRGGEAALAGAANPAEAEAIAARSESVDFALPMVEELDRPEARVYELSNADLAVVMIVDAGLDV
jgi:hypothetical protein